MGDKLSRRNFLKGAAGAVGAAAIGSLAGCKIGGKGVYTPGTYSATAKGIGEVSVSMTFSESKITDVVLNVAHETENIGQAAAADLKKAIMSAQSAEIDAVTGATVTSNAVKTAVQNCIAQAKGESVVSTVTGASEEVAEDDWLGHEPHIGNIDETKECDVLIVGAGLSGICAARSAAEEGAKVILIEKSKSFNCRSGEYALLNGTLNKRWGRENIVDTDTVVNKEMHESTYRAKRPIHSRWAREAHEAMDWFIGAYPDLTICDSTREKVTQEQFDKGILVPLSWPLPAKYNYKEEEFPTYPSSMEFRSSRRDQQGFMVEAQLKDAQKNGAEVVYETFGRKILKDSSGRVTGVIAEKEGKFTQYNAKKGVILATGDNSADDKILRHFTPEVLEKKLMRMATMGMLGVDAKGDPISTGDGLRMGAWAGAKVQDYHAPMTHHMGGGQVGKTVGVTPFLQLNKHGERFMNECIPGQQLENQMELQPEHTSFQIYDSNWGRQIPYMPANHGGLCYIIPEDEDESNPNFSDRQYTKISAKEQEGSYDFKADTIEDLLKQIGYEGKYYEKALASIKRYNELARKGVDEDFGKSGKRMFALEKGPYYANRWGTTVMLVCLGGLESDENCHTFTAGTPENPTRDIIPGLYVTGNVQGSRFAVEYPISMRGISHSMCVFYGFVAGKNAVKGI